LFVVQNCNNLNKSSFTTNVIEASLICILIKIQLVIFICSWRVKNWHKTVWRVC